MKPSKEPTPRTDEERWRELVSENDVLEIARELSRASPERGVELFRKLSREQVEPVLGYLEPSQQAELLKHVPEESALELLERMDPDDRTRLFEAMPPELAQAFLQRLSPRETALTETLLAYPEESSGRIMTPEVLRLSPAMSVEEAMEKVRTEAPSVETIYSLPVTDEGGRLLGMVELKDLVLARPDQRLDELMRTDIRTVHPTVDQEEAARLIQSTRDLSIPVVTDDRRLLGLITYDDAVKVLVSEEEEDLARTAATEPLRAPYFSVSIFRMARRRVVWLFLLAFAAILTVNVLNAFEETLEAIVSLALFIPLLIGVGGNAGTQTATTVIRAMAVDQVRAGDWLEVILRESRAGLLLGALLGAVGFLPVAAFFGRPMALVVSMTLVAICTLASLVGAMMPLLARRVGVDPAVVSAPFVTTLVDATGLLVYFLIARAVLSAG